MSDVPFLFNFSESVDPIEVSGYYDEQSQMLLDEHNNLAAQHTGLTKTETGGWGDQDTDHD